MSSLLSSSFLTLSSPSARKRILSRASDALEMSSLRKISFFWYKLLMMMSIKRVISAWYSYFSPLRGATVGATEGEGVAAGTASPPLILMTGVSAAASSEANAAPEKQATAAEGRKEEETQARG